MAVHSNSNTVIWMKAGKVSKKLFTKKDKINLWLNVTSCKHKIKYKHKAQEDIPLPLQLPLLRFQAGAPEHGSGALMPQGGARWLQYSLSVHFPHSTSAETTLGGLEPDRTEVAVEGQYK